MVRVRPIEVDDLEALTTFVASIDPTAAEGEGALSRASLSFYERTGHAFVAESAHTICGVVLAQAVWDGVRPTVRMQHLIVADEDLQARAALLEALTKSAYDAAVYDLVAEVSSSDELTKSWLEDNAWRKEPKTSFRRTLGSRGS